jgi:hypothetical protein
MKKATKGNEKKPMIRNVVPSTYKMGNDNVCLSLSLFLYNRDPQNLKLLLLLPFQLIFFFPEPSIFQIQSLHPST